MSIQEELFQFLDSKESHRKIRNKFVLDFMNKYSSDNSMDCDKHPWWFLNSDKIEFMQSQLTENEKNMIKKIKESDKDSLEFDRYNLKHHRVMLHPLIMEISFYICSTIKNESVLEIGSYTGGLTAVICKAIKKNKNNINFISVEADKEVYEECKIVLDLWNLLESEYFEYVNTFSSIANDKITPKLDKLDNKIGLLIIDADGCLSRDLILYWGYLNIGCFIIIDDYFSVHAKEKVIEQQIVIDHLLKNKFIEIFSYLPWGTIIVKKLKN